MNQQDLNDYLIRENLRLKAQVEFLTSVTLDIVGQGHRFDEQYVGLLGRERPTRADIFIRQGVKKFLIPLVEDSPLLDERDRERFIIQINKQ